MAIRTENLTILFVDIAGFTATTSRQSRAQNAQLLQSFNNTLQPLIRSFKGTLVKSIGDAMLLTFRSPTDAMLCAMALQDAMHGHNLRVTDDEKIHIRVAANLGEVRISNKDIFGEPVNVCSRIESIAPADEIWLSDAVYMAMNKAEVPAVEVGLRELAGVAHPVRIYCIPRFANPRLIAEPPAPLERGSELMYPYGGMHHRAPHSAFPVRQRNVLAAVVVAGVALAVGFLVLLPYLNAPAPGPGTPAQSHTQPVTAVSTPPAQTEASISPKVESKASTQTINKPVPTTGAELKQTPVPPGSAAQSKPTVTSAAAVVSATTPPADQSPKQPAAKPVAKPVTKTETKTVVSKTAVPSAAPSTATPETKPAPEPVEVIEKTKASGVGGDWSLISAKQAYRDEKISKAEYRVIIDKLETDYDEKVRGLKLAYKAKTITKQEYAERINALKRAYKGERE